MLEEYHNFLQHEEKSAAYICDCGVGGVIREQFLEHLRAAHNVRSVKGATLEERFFVWGVPTFTHIFRCGDCFMRTPLFHVFQNHDCQLYGRDTRDLPRKRDYERYLATGQIPYETVPVIIRRRVTEWLLKNKKQVPENFYSKEADEAIKRVEILEAEKQGSAAEGSADEEEMDTGESLSLEPTRVRHVARDRDAQSRTYGPGRRNHSRGRPRGGAGRGAPAGGRPSRGGSAGGRPSGGKPPGGGKRSPSPQRDKSKSPERGGSKGGVPPPDVPPSGGRGFGGGPPEKRPRHEFTLDVRYLQWHKNREPQQNASSYREYEDLLFGGDKERYPFGGIFTGIGGETVRIRMEKRPIAGSFLVVDRVSDVKAFACVTYHPDNPDRYDAPKKYNQYNPCNYPYVAEIVNYERRPAQTTHFLALSCGIEFAEYRLVQQPVADVPQNTVIFFDDVSAAYSNQMVPEDPAAVRAYLDRR